MMGDPVETISRAQALARFWELSREEAENQRFYAQRLEELKHAALLESHHVRDVWWAIGKLIEIEERRQLSAKKAFELSGELMRAVNA